MVQVVAAVMAAMTATTATQSKTEGQCANGADTVRMTPAATPVMQTALALTTTVTTMRTAQHCNDQNSRPAQQCRSQPDRQQPAAAM